MPKTVFALIMALLAAALPGACSTPPAAIKDTQPAGTRAADSTVTVVVTRDFGRELVLEKDAEAGAGNAALTALQAVARVETKYGGGFVSSIDGIGPGSGGAGAAKEDWFFYINGIASNIGAGDYILRAGDIEHWDLRDWGYQQFVPAIVGDYPQPFRSGYSGKAAPTFVVYAEPFAAEAESLVEKLQGDGISPVSAVIDTGLSDEVKGHSNLIIIARPENGLVAELNQAHKKLGLYAYFASNGLTVLDAKGDPSGEYGPGSGLIQATQNPWNPRGIGAAENVVWMLTGPDADAVRSAAAALVNDGDKLHHIYAAVVSEDRIVSIP